MGVAEAIPGVSGGTIAFITGIYERLLQAIRSILDPAIIGMVGKEGFAAAWKHIDGSFLVQLVGGMVVGLVVATFTITELLVMYPPAVWAFFFGLIIASAIYIARQVGKWAPIEIVLFVLGTAVAYGLTVLNPLNGSENPLLVFMAGAIAISALILPGISGSFILVLLGMYTVVFPALRGLLSGDLSQLTTFLSFGFGCLAGMAVFSRVLTYTFKTYPNQTLALLTGFMLGSLNKLWPWRNALTTRIDSSGEVVPVLEKNVLPAAYDGNPLVVAVIISFLVGLAIVFILEAVSGNKPSSKVKE